MSSLNSPSCIGEKVRQHRSVRQETLQLPENPALKQRRTASEYRRKQRNKKSQEPKPFRVRSRSIPTFALGQAFAKSREEWEDSWRTWSIRRSPKTSLKDVDQSVNDEPLECIRRFSLRDGKLVNEGDVFRPRSSTGRSGTSSKSSLAKPSPVLSPSFDHDSIDQTSDLTPKFRVLVLGCERTGKTGLLKQFKTSDYINPFADVSAGVENEFLSLNVSLNDQESIIDFFEYDIGWENQWLQDEADGYILLYAVDDRRSFHSIQESAKYLLKKFDEHSYQKPIIIAANKIDLVRRRKVKKEEGEKLAETLACEQIEIALAVNHDVDKLLVKLLNLLRSRSQPPLQSQDNLKTGLKNSHLKAAEDSLFQQTFHKKSKKFFFFDALAKRLNIS